MNNEAALGWMGSHDFLRRAHGGSLYDVHQSE